VIVRPDRTVASVGYNGLPRGVDDGPARLNDRTTKHAMTVHAEANAVLTAHGDLGTCTAYTSLRPCAGCAGLLIQAGIRRVVAPTLEDGQHQAWQEQFTHAQTMFDEAGVVLDLVEVAR
jgi:dCMP deaminase